MEKIHDHKLMKIFRLHNCEKVEQILNFYIEIYNFV